jgi:ribonuclease P protein component
VERRCRLQGRDRFRAIRERGKRWVHPLVILGGIPNGLDCTRCGFVTSSRLGIAVVRNRVRRRLREAVRLCYGHISPGWDLVWIARPPLVRADFQQVSGAVAALLQQARLWQAPREDGHA